MTATRLDPNLACCEPPACAPVGPHSPMNSQFPRCAQDRSNTVGVLPSDLLEQFHLRSPVHRPPCRLRRQSSQLVSEGGQNVMSTPGRNQISEIINISSD